MTGVTTITLGEAKERIRRLAEERPDYVYEQFQFDKDRDARCVYFDPAGKPSCIVGHAFADELRAAGVDFSTRATVHGLTKRAALALDPAAEGFLGHVQAFQDTGTPWGEAYRKALDLTVTG